MATSGIMNIPNLLSMIRLACSPLLIVTAWAGSPTAFFVLLFLMLISDALDGYLARKWHQTSELGAKLDSIGDYATYLGIAAGAWLLWPERILRESGVIVFVIIVYILPLAVSLIKFRQLNSYHTLLAKVTAVVFSAGVILFLLLDLVWPFYASVFVLLLEALENIAITLTLKRPRTDIRSFWDLRKENA